jgi:hypothetical protein
LKARRHKGLGDPILSYAVKLAIKQPVEIRLVVAEDSWRSTSPVLLYLEMFP